MKKTKMPTKQTLNLMIKEKTLAHPTRLVPILLLIFLGAYAFAQFAVIARLNKVKQAEAELSQMRSNLEMLQASYADYDEVKAEYNRYTYQNYDRTLPDRLDVLALLERRVFTVCTAQSLSIAQRTVTMTLAGLTLDDVSALIASLKEEPMVFDAFVSSTSSSTKDSSKQNIGGADTVTAITITLNDPTTIVGEPLDESGGENGDEDVTNEADDGTENRPEDDDTGGNVVIQDNADADGAQTGGEE